MTFRMRLILAAAVAVAVAVALASIVAYVLVRNELRRQVDNALIARATAIAPALHIEPDFVTQRFVVDLPGPTFGEAGGYLQAVDVKGHAVLTRGETTKLPVTKRVIAVAAGAPPFFTDARVSGVHLRIYTFPGQQDLSSIAFELTRPLTEVDHALHQIRFVLIFVTLGGVALAAALGLGVARTALAPVRKLTETTEYVSDTRDLRSRIATSGSDELSRLATSFNTMLGALEQSVDAQRQLVADASHELRTPLTSLRTNIEVLSREGDKLAPGERERLLTDVTEQLAEMSVLVAELVELARGEQQPHEPEDVRLDLLVEHAVERARRNAPDIHFESSVEPSTVHGVPSAIERAVGNLLDNAAKWSPAGATVDVSVRDGKIVVRDRGPGIDDADLPHVFDRFYRAPGARGRPGSGLGLAIVKQVAEAHGGRVRAARAEGGGTQIELELNGTARPGANEPALR